MYRDQSIQGEGKKENYFPHKQLGTDLNESEVPAYYLLPATVQYLSLPANSMLPVLASIFISTRSYQVCFLNQ